MVPQAKVVVRRFVVGLRSS